MKKVRFMMWSDCEMVRLSRANKMSVKKLKAFMRTHAPFLDQKVDGDDPAAPARLARIAVAMVPPGSTHYVERIENHNKAVLWGSS
jgi:hypothetical protein